jgi:SAM-dependent methyltransferase
MSEINHCPGCEGTRHNPLEKIDLGEQHRKYVPADEDICRRLTAEAQKSASSYQMFRCSDCGLEFAWPMRAPPESWYEIAYQALNLYPLLRWEFDACLEAFDSQDTVFEFGCGGGAFLERCGKKGIKAVGTDFLIPSIEICRQKNLDAIELDINGPLPEAAWHSASQVVAFHVCEHLEQPRLLFERAAQAAKPKAKLWIAVPSSIRPTRQRGIVELLDQPPHHLTRWNRSALEKIGSDTGWQLVRLQYEETSFYDSLWWMTVTSPWYRRWKQAGRLKNPLVERALRLATYPYAAIRRVTVDREVSGDSMLACYVRSSSTNGPSLIKA